MYSNVALASNRNNVFGDMKSRFDIEDVQRAFLAAMAGGYAASAEPSPIDHCMPGWKQNWTTISGTPQFIVSDSWFSNSEDYSSGITTIACQNEIIWAMHYGGWYKPEARQILKEALSLAYFIERKFNGGRGPDVFTRKGERILYHNNVERAEFNNFSGNEGVVGEVNGIPTNLGYHWYHGGFLTTKFA